jgi:phosphomannomutase
MTLIKSISGIRGTIGGEHGNNLTPRDVVNFTGAYAQWLISSKKAEENTVVVGRDARISGPVVQNIVMATLQGMGINVIDVGLTTTPTVEVAVTGYHAQGGIIITASHNPAQWNALKLLNSNGEFLSQSDGETILSFIEAGNIKYAPYHLLGKVERKEDALDLHIRNILHLDLVDKKAIESAGFKVVIDCVNSVGGIAVPALLEAMGVADVEKIYCEPNGEFPHNPEPLPENLTDIVNRIKSSHADVGFVVDPDVDRLAIVCEDGSFFGEEYTLVSVADYILQHKKGNTVSNLSSTRALKDITLDAGGEYYSAAVGEVNVVEKMKAVSAVIGGEGNGGVIYPELHYGRDALAGIALFLSYLAKTKLKCSALRNKFPDYIISKNKIELDKNIDVGTILEKIKKAYSSEKIIDIDGVKIEFENEWVHLRKSNTEPIIRIYAESRTKAKADQLANSIMERIKEIVNQ